MPDQILPEIIEQMAASDDVRVRATGVIAKFLREDVSKDEETEVDAAKRLIKCMTAADLLTFLRSDIVGYLDQLGGYVQ